MHVRFGRRASETDGSNAARRWCSTLPYIPLAKGFIYLVAIMDWHSRAVLAWRTSNTLHADFCVEALEEALRRFGRPEIFNTDQGSQFTSTDFTGLLLENKIAISMDARGAWRDNVFVERLWRSAVWCMDISLDLSGPYSVASAGVAPKIRDSDAFHSSLATISNFARPLTY